MAPAPLDQPLPGDHDLMTLRRTATIGGLAVGALVALLLLTLGVVWFVQRDQALPGTSIDGIDVGGLTAAEIRDRVAPQVTAREDEPVVVSGLDSEWTVVPTELGYRVDVDGTVEAALSRGRDGLPGDVSTRIAALRSRELAIPLIERYDEDQIETWVADIAADLDRDEVRGDVTIDPDTFEVEVTAPVGSTTVRQEETAEALLAAFLSEGPDELPLPVDTTPPPRDEAELRAVAAEVERAIAEPLVLSGSGAELTLERGDLVRLIDLRDVDDGEVPIELVVTEEAVEEVMGEVAPGRFDVSPVSATYTVDRTPPTTFDEPSSSSFSPVEASVGIEEGRDGARFDAATAATQLTELLREGARTAEVRLEAVEPPLPNERAEELRPTHLLGTFTTYYTAGEDRNLNIQRLADVIDGAQVLPGEQFSINDISGERECDRGYVPAGTIVQGELVDTCGGGVSQFGTTTFNAAFFSGVQLDEWRAHSWYISRYPMGREATLTYPTLDVRFTNTTDGAIVVKTDHTSSSVTVSVYGQPIAEQVSATHGEPTDPTTFETETRTTSDLPQGQESVVQSGTNGFTVEVERVVDLIGGGEDSETIRTVYVPQTRIIERGTR